MTFKHTPDIFAETEPRVALDEFITLFGNFWTYTRRAHARLAVAAATDTDLTTIIASRNEPTPSDVVPIVAATAYAVLRLSPKRTRKKS